MSVRELYEEDEARESDRDSAIESAAGSELSDGGRGGEKEEPLHLFMTGQKFVILIIISRYTSFWTFALVIVKHCRPAEIWV